MKKLALSPLPFQLPARCGLEKIEIFHELKDFYRSFSRGNATLDSWHLKRKEEILTAVKDGKSIQKIINNIRDIRIILLLWQSKEFFEDIPFNKSHLQIIKLYYPSPSPTILRQLTHLFFNYFDSLGSVFLDLAEYIKKGLGSLTGRLSSDIMTYKKASSTLFKQLSPKIYAAVAVKRNIPFEQIRDKLQIPDSGHNRFLELTRFEYYIENLKKVPFGETTNIFSEVTHNDVKEAPYGDGLMLGHAIVKLLIERTRDQNERMPEAWQEFVLEIMGDPRVPPSSPFFLKWWGRLDDRYHQAMSGWLSQFDLKLFLEVLNETRYNLNDREAEAFDRMYPARRKFLEGLDDLRVIKNTRLLLSDNAISTLKSSGLGKNIKYCRLYSTHISVIYLQLQNSYTGQTVHAFEGTHNFSFRIYDVPPLKGIADFSQTDFYFSNITSAEFLHRIPHQGEVRWQHKIINALSNKPFELEIRPEAVLTEEDYSSYRWKYGMYGL